MRWPRLVDLTARERAKVGLLSWLFGGRVAEPEDPKSLRDAISIDISGPEFHDYYPDAKEFEERLRETGMFRENDLESVATALSEAIRSGAGYRAATDRIVRAGDRLLSKLELKQLGVHHARKIGIQFRNTLNSDDIVSGIEALDVMVHAVSARRLHLHNLRRFEESGIARVRYMSAGDERVTAFEKSIDGMEMTVSRAREIARDHDVDVRRGVFLAVVEFDGQRFT